MIPIILKCALDANLSIQKVDSWLPGAGTEENKCLLLGMRFLSEVKKDFADGCTTLYRLY